MYNDLQQYPRYQAYQGQQPQSPAAVPYQMMPQMPQNYIKGRPVVSIDEARASQIDLDGSLYVFTDIGNNRIYTKQINPLTGTATLNVFTLSKEDAAAPAPDFITRAEFNSALEELKNSLMKPTAAATPAPPQPQKIVTNF